VIAGQAAFFDSDATIFGEIDDAAETGEHSTGDFAVDGVVDDENGEGIRGNRVEIEGRLLGLGSEEPLQGGRGYGPGSGGRECERLRQ